MSKIIYLPLERLDMRYTDALDEQIMTYAIQNRILIRRIYPELLDCGLPTGAFLNAGQTINFKAKQLLRLAEMYASDEIDSGDVIFVSDLWFPGIEAVAYLNHFYKKSVKLKGIVHAGSWTDTDEVRQMERWASHMETAIFDIADEIFVGSYFSAEELLKKRMVDPSKVTTTPFPLDYKRLNKWAERTEVKNEFKVAKQNIVVFNGRHHPEKQPWKFDEIKRFFKDKADWEFIDTHSMDLNKDDYYRLLAKSKIVISFALQENFGFGIQEAVYLGCIPVLPNRLVYKEHYDTAYLYDNDLDMYRILNEAMEGYLGIPNTGTNDHQTLSTWLDLD